jgi:hypothetical protein
LAISYLSAVNQVLVRLRESQVTTVAQNSYSQLIGALINDAKREIEDSWQWSFLQDTISFSTVAGTYFYDIAATATDIRTTQGFENQLRNEASFTDQAIKFAVINQNALGPPGVWQLIESPTSTTAGQWNKRVLLYQIPDKVYTMKMYIVNPQLDLVNDTDLMLCPTAPVVLKAYLFALFERGEELGEQLTLTTDKVEQSLSDAIAFDQSNTSTYLGFSVPTGAQY